jgi:DnaJ-class molecular chaperone
LDFHVNEIQGINNNNIISSISQTLLFITINIKERYLSVLMLKEYYDILGISPSASDDEIKQAYRKLAREHHPDKGGNKEHFQKIQQAYEILSDPNKRNHQEDIHFSPFGFTHHFRNNTEIIKKADNHYTCKLSLNEVYFGVSKKFKVKRVSMCKICREFCPVCRGTGIISQTLQLGPLTQFLQQPCGRCGSAGFIRQQQKTCQSCNSSGQIEENKIFEINIPRGVESGKQFCFAEWGEQANKSNEISGNFIVTIYVEIENKCFERDKLDLIYNTNLSLKESIISKTITIPYFGKDLTISTLGFGIINPQKQYTIFNKGLIDENGECGHLHIRFSIDYPNMVLAPHQQEALQSAFEHVGL